MDTPHEDTTPSTDPTATGLYILVTATVDKSHTSTDVFPRPDANAPYHSDQDPSNGAFVDALFQHNGERIVRLLEAPIKAGTDTTEVEAWAQDHVDDLMAMDAIAQFVPANTPNSNQPTGNALYSV